MSRRTQIGLMVILVPPFLLIFTVVHEVGHTVLARLLGDPNAAFYLFKITRTSMCLGCNIYDENKLSAVGNLLVAIGGLLFTQMAAMGILLLARLTPTGSFRRRVLVAGGLAFAFLDVPVQVLQGLLATIARQSRLSGVDLADFLYLASRGTGFNVGVLKVVVLLLSVIYLVFIYQLCPREKAARPAAHTAGG